MSAGSAFSTEDMGSKLWTLSSVGTLPVDDAGEELLIAAFGHPQTRWRPTIPAFGPEYSGRARLADVALQLRIDIGESIEISKCRLFPGFSVSTRDIRITI